MSWLFPVVYVVGMLITTQVLRRKAGIMHARRIRIFGPGGVGIKWFVVSTVKAVLWPVTVGVWAVRAIAR